MGLIFCSGLCALVYQIVWLRELRLIFGSSTAASAVVLAVFMGGIGLGATVIGKKTGRFHRPLALYAYLEGGIAISALLSPFLLFLAHHLYLNSGGVGALGYTGSLFLRLGLAASILFLPAFLMGGSLPAMAMAVERPEDRARRDIGLLYGFNTLGGVLGVILATFLLLEIFGNRLTIWSAGVMNLLIAAIAIFIDRKSGHRSSNTSCPVQRDDKLSPRKCTKITFPYIIIYTAAFTTGFVFLLQELVWYRMLAPLLGGSTYTFGLILAVALAGIGLGGWMFGLRSKNIRPSLRVFSLVCALETLFLIIPYALGDRVAILAALTNGMSVMGFEGQVLGWTIITCLVVLPVAICAGVQFPMLISLLGEGDENIAEHTGFIYGFNTAGAILGSLAGGFGLIPLLTAPVCWQLSVFLLILLAICTLLTSLHVEKKSAFQLLPTTCILLSLFLLPSEGPTATWRHRSIGIGLQTDLSGMSRNQLTDWSEKYRRQIIWEQEGRESSIALHSYDSLSFIVNGKSDGNAVLDAPTQIMGPLIGTVLHPEPNNALVIGLGSGSSAGWLAMAPTMGKVDVVEIEPAMLEVARRCSAVNFHVTERPNVNIIVGDGREFVQTTNQTYDIIFSEPSDPYRAGIASLYTREFYRAVSSKLAPNGIFSQWLQTYYVDGPTIRTIAATLGSIFSHVEIWLTDDSNLLFVCSNSPIQYHADKLSAKLINEPFKTAMRNAWGTNGLEGFLAAFLAQSQVTREITDEETASGNINTDDKMRAEFSFAKIAGRTGLFSVNDLRQNIKDKNNNRPEIHSGEIDWQKVEDNYFKMMLWFGKSFVQKGNGAGETLHQVAAAYKGHMDGNYQPVLSAWKKGIWPDDSLSFQVVLAEALAEYADPRSLEFIEKIREAWPGTADAIKARYYWRQGNSQMAHHALKQAISEFHKTPWQFRAVIIHGLQLAMEMSYNDVGAKDFFDLLRKPLSVNNYDEYRKFALLQIGKMLGPQKAAQALDQWEPHVPWNETFLQDRVQIYTKTGSPLVINAERDLKKFQAQQPGSFFN